MPSLAVKWANRAPAPVGSNRTETEHVSPGSSQEPCMHDPSALESDGKSPDEPATVRLVRITVSSPMFCSENTCGAVDPPEICWLPKSNSAGENCSSPAALMPYSKDEHGSFERWLALSLGHYCFHYGTIVSGSLVTCLLAKYPELLCRRSPGLYENVMTLPAPRPLY